MNIEEILSTVGSDDIYMGLAIIVVSISIAFWAIAFHWLLAAKEAHDRAIRKAYYKRLMQKRN